MKSLTALRNCEKHHFFFKKTQKLFFCVFYWKRCCPSSLKSDSRTFRKHDLQFPGASKHKNNWKNRTFRDGSAPKNHQKPFFLEKVLPCDLRAKTFWKTSFFCNIFSKTMKFTRKSIIPKFHRIKQTQGFWSKHRKDLHVKNDYLCLFWWKMYGNCFGNRHSKKSKLIIFSIMWIHFMKWT